MNFRLKFKCYFEYFSWRYDKCDKFGNPIKNYIRCMMQIFTGVVLEVKHTAILASPKKEVHLDCICNKTCMYIEVHFVNIFSTFVMVRTNEF